MKIATRIILKKKKKCGDIVHNQTNSPCCHPHPSLCLQPERRRPFGTGLVRHCPQGLFSPFFTFLRAIYFFARLDFSSSPLSAPGSPRMPCCLFAKSDSEFRKKTRNTLFFNLLCCVISFHSFHTFINDFLTAALRCHRVG